MTTTTTPVPQFAVAGGVLEAMADQAFARLANSLSADAHMQALVPRGLLEFAGAQAICAAFEGWFGDATDYQLVEADLGSVGPRLHLHWRLRARAEKLGSDWHVVEQHVYADTGADGRISNVRLMCSGFCPE